MLFKPVFSKGPYIPLIISVLWLIFSCVWSMMTISLESGIFFNVYLELLFFHGLIGFTAYYYNLILMQTKLVSNNDYALLFLLILLLSTFNFEPLTLVFMSGFLGLGFILKKLLLTYNKGDSVIQEFEMGMFAGLLFVLNPMFLLALPFIVFSLGALKSNTWRDFVVIVLGFLLILVFKLSASIFLGHGVDFQELFEIGFVLPFFNVAGNAQFVSVFFLVGVVLFSLNHFFRVSDQLNIKTRIFYKIWCSLSLFLFLGTFIIKNSLTSLQALLCGVLPLTALFKLTLKSVGKPFVREVLLLLFVLASVLLKWTLMGQT